MYVTLHSEAETYLNKIISKTDIENYYNREDLKRICRPLNLPVQGLKSVLVD